MPPPSFEPGKEIESRSFIETRTPIRSALSKASRRLRLQRSGEIRQRLDVVAALAQALDVKLEDLPRRDAGLEPALLRLFREQFLRLRIEPDCQRLAICCLRHERFHKQLSGAPRRL